MSVKGRNMKMQNLKKLAKFMKFSAVSRKLRNNETKSIDGGDFIRSVSDLESGNQKWRALRFLGKGTQRDYLYDGSFHQAVGPVLVVAQCFCLMPVRGIKENDVRKLTFVWSSFRTLYCLLYVGSTIFDTILTINLTFSGDDIFGKFEAIVFHLSILFASIGFLRLAQKWPKLMRQWSKVESQLPILTTSKEKSELAKRIKWITIIALTLSFAEHLLSNISAIHFANHCPSRNGPIESFLQDVSPQIFLVFDYSLWLASFGKIQNVLLTFGWSYMDIFVMIMGVGLSTMLKRFQDNLEKYQGQQMNERFWEKSRTQFRNIRFLIDEIDDAISTITVLSFANNLYFVCIQLLKSIRKMPSIVHAVYFYFSLLFLLGRTLAVSLYLAEVNDRSKQPLVVINCVPQESWCSEVERFSMDIVQDDVALTGMKFFNITRKLVLTVAGTIITYELVLIQFQGTNPHQFCEKKWN